MSNVALNSCPPDPCCLLTVERAAQLLGIGRTHFYKLHDSGRVPLPVRLGKSIRWRREELLDWIKAGCPERSAWEAIKKRIKDSTL